MVKTYSTRKKRTHKKHYKYNILRHRDKNITASNQKDPSHPNINILLYSFTDQCSAKRKSWHQINITNICIHVDKFKVRRLKFTWLMTSDLTSLNQVTPAQCSSLYCIASLSFSIYEWKKISFVFSCIIVGLSFKCFVKNHESQSVWIWIVHYYTTKRWKLRFIP